MTPELVVQLRTVTQFAVRCCEHGCLWAGCKFVRDITYIKDSRCNASLGTCSKHLVL